MIKGVISRRCYSFEYRITCYICDTDKIRYGPSAWSRVNKCYDKDAYIWAYIFSRIKYLETAKKREMRIKDIALRMKNIEFIQKQIDKIIETAKEDAIIRAKGEWFQSFVRWKDMMEDAIEKFLDLAAKKKCASYGGPGTICAKWEIRNLDFIEEIIEKE